MQRNYFTVLKLFLFNFRETTLDLEQNIDKASKNILPIKKIF